MVYIKLITTVPILDPTCGSYCHLYSEGKLAVLTLRLTFPSGAFIDLT